MSTKVINTIQKSDFSFWLVSKMFRFQFAEMVGIPQNLYEELSHEDQKYGDNILDFMHPMSPENIHEAEIRPLTGKAMGTISVPTIILHTKDDFLVTYDHAEFLNKHINNSVLVSFESGGHALIAETEVINERIKDFITSNQ